MPLSLQALREELLAIHAAVVRAGEALEPRRASLPSTQAQSATNLLQYLALRRYDLRPIQVSLAAHGLSSLGRTESHVRSGLEAVIGVLHRIEGLEWTPPSGDAAVTMEAGEALLALHADNLFGPRPADRVTRVMVTMPSEAATDYELVRGLVAAGMDCMRVNCAHDGPAEWTAMIAHLRRASAEIGRHCTVCMDIAGPKLRTGPIEPDVAVQRIKPRRDKMGRVSAPAVVALKAQTATAVPSVDADAVLSIEGILPTVGPGDAIEFADVRGRRRTLRVTGHRGDSIVATLDRTAYIVPGTRLRVAAGPRRDEISVADVPTREQALHLMVGDLLILTRADEPGRAAIRDSVGRITASARVGVTLPEVLDDIRPGESIWFDDGRIGGIVRSAEQGEVVVEVTHAGPEGDWLRAGKGINLPDTELHVSALTRKDLDDLAFVAAHADLVGYSFVRTAEDVFQLQEHLRTLGGAHLGIILKIETRRAFEELPRLLLACMRTGRFGVMIARGDLAIECGYERMAEVQEEILWIAEAAHAPVIWATQVLETLAKTGLPSRAEVTDAAMAERAECVMMNKGPHILEAVRTLCDILRRMEAHQQKKRPRLRPLRIAADVGWDPALPAVR